MNDFDTANRENFDARLTRALEAAPQVAIADDFALRVMRKLPARRKVALPTEIAAPRIGRRVMFAALAVLFVAMVALGISAHGGRAYSLVEWSLAAEFVMIIVWISLRPQTS